MILGGGIRLLSMMLSWESGRRMRGSRRGLDGMRWLWTRKGSQRLYTRGVMTSISFIREVGGGYDSKSVLFILPLGRMIRYIGWVVTGNCMSGSRISTEKTSG